MISVPRSDRLHIALFGRRNVGKSSLINALTGQEVAVVSPVAGTTTDPVYKSMELLPLGPVVFIDTPGLDDDSVLGPLRIEKTKAILRKTGSGASGEHSRNPLGTDGRRVNGAVSEKKDSLYYCP